MTFNPSYRKFNNSPQDESRGWGGNQETAPKQLPMDASREAFLESVRNQESTILIGETGSGKTTCTPGYLLDEFPDAKIVFTSPRVLPALSVSEYVAEKRGQKIGQEIGVITRQEKNVSDDTRLTFMTDGVLLSMFKKDPLLMEFDIVTIDEAHERSLNIDLCLGLLKQAQKNRKAEGKKELKIIVASATLEEEKFVTYFDEVPPLKVPGRMYPVDVVYVSPVLNDRGELETDAFMAAECTKRILASGKGGDILIFMPGEQEIYKTIDEIESIVGFNESLEILPLYSSLKKEEQKKVFYKNGKRKIIVSTNIAETSITIPGVRHVIDTGTVKQKNYNPETGIDELKLIETSQANMNQRTGRAGRTAPGTCYRLMNKEDFKMREEFQKSEIKRANLGETVLRMKDMGIDDVEGFDFIESPSKASLRDALSQLRALGALDTQDRITDIGKEMAHLEMRPDLSRMLIEAKHQGALPAMVDLCSMISSSKQVMIQGRPEKAKTHEEVVKLQEQMKNQKKLNVPSSDFLTLLTIWDKWTESGYSGSFAYNHLLNAQALKEVGLTRNQLLKNLAEGGIQVDQNNEPVNVSKMLRCLYVGSPDALMFSGDGGRSYYPFNDDPYRMGAQIFPGSSVFKSGAKLIFALNVERTEKKVVDRYTGNEVIRSNLWAKTCHRLTLDDVRTLSPTDVVERKEGEISTSYYGSYDYYQAYGVYVFGKKIDVIRKPVEGYNPDDYNLYRDNKFEEEVFVAIPSRVGEVLLEIHRDNYDVQELVKAYINRSSAPIIFSKEQEEKLQDIYGFYAEVITKYDIKTKEDILEHERDFELFLEDFISDEDKEKIDREAPKMILGNGKIFAVTYKNDVGGVCTATIKISNPEDISDLLDATLPPFSGRREVLFSLDYMQPQVRNYNLGLRYSGNSEKSTIVFHSIDELEAYNEQYKKLEEKRLRRQERKETSFSQVLRPSQATEKTEENETISPVQKSPEKKEKVETIALDVADIRTILGHLRGLAQEKHVRELKDKDKVLERIKEVSGRSVEMVKNMESAGETTLSQGEMSELLQSVRAIAKRIGIPSVQAEQLPFVYKHNQHALSESAKRNDVEVDDVLLKKISTKSMEYTVEKNVVFTDGEADEIIIELV